MKLSNYVFLTVQDGESVFYDLTQKKALPISSSEDVLLANYFLAGQEQEALFHTIFKNRKRLVLVIIPTWACNFRCKHCVVYDRLKVHPALDEPGINVELLTDFIKRYVERYSPEFVELRFCGGEPLLCWEKIRDIIESVKKIGINLKINMTTNLAVDVNSEILDLLKEFTTFGVSVDGVEEYHNQQRVSLTKGVNPYQQVIGNLKKVMLAGLRDKVFVQAAINEWSTDSVREYYRAMLRVGLHKDKIGYAATTPHAKNPPGSYYLSVLKNDIGTFRTPCCKYQPMAQFVVSPYNTLHTDFYVYEEIGQLTSSFEEISAKFKESIFREMPVLLDSNCQKCSVIGHCWGGCSNNNYYHGLNAGPSSNCNRETILMNVYRAAKEGLL
jgi:radical SAM protein with 4Fe4S-binding SPASM domain